MCQVLDAIGLLPEDRILRWGDRSKRTLKVEGQPEKELRVPKKLKVES
jgi:hypothetical protein